MLVLTRKLRETIHIDGDIVITVLQVQGKAIRIGIEAPRNVRVLRGELAPNRPPVATSHREDISEPTPTPPIHHACPDRTKACRPLTPYRNRKEDNRRDSLLQSVAK